MRICNVNYFGHGELSIRQFPKGSQVAVLGFGPDGEMEWMMPELSVGENIPEDLDQYNIPTGDMNQKFFRKLADALENYHPGFEVTLVIRDTGTQGAAIGGVYAVKETGNDRVLATRMLDSENRMSQLQDKLRKEKELYDEILVAREDLAMHDKMLAFEKEEAAAATREMQGVVAMNARAEAGMYLNEVLQAIDDAECFDEVAAIMGEYCMEMGRCKSGQVNDNYCPVCKKGMEILERSE